jgi:hypothetical protein
VAFLLILAATSLCPLPPGQLNLDPEEMHRAEPSKPLDDVAIEDTKPGELDGGTRRSGQSLDNSCLVHVRELVVQQYKEH